MGHPLRDQTTPSKQQVLRHCQHRSLVSSVLPATVPVALSDAVQVAEAGTWTRPIHLPLPPFHLKAPEGSIVLRAALPLPCLRRCTTPCIVQVAEMLVFATYQCSAKVIARVLKE